MVLRYDIQTVVGTVGKMASGTDVIYAVLAIFVSGTGRLCFSRLFDQPNGCTTDSAGTHCVCDTDLCNSGVMTSSLGHVIAAVAVLACVITAGYLQL